MKINCLIGFLLSFGIFEINPGLGICYNKTVFSNICYVRIFATLSLRLGHIVCVVIGNVIIIKFNFVIKPMSAKTIVNGIL